MILISRAPVCLGCRVASGYRQRKDRESLTGAPESNAAVQGVRGGVVGLGVERQAWFTPLRDVGDQIMDQGGAKSASLGTGAHGQPRKVGAEGATRGELIA